jgi:serine protease AprX
MPRVHRAAPESKDVRQGVLDLIYGDTGAKRFTQDSPILPDVWLEYAENPRGRVKLLLTPHSGVEPGELARRVYQRLCKKTGDDAGAARVAYNASIVAADLTLDEVLACVLPLSPWWHKRLHADRAWHFAVANPKDARAFLASSKCPKDLAWLVRLYAGIRAARTKKGTLTSPTPARMAKAAADLGRQATSSGDDKPLLWLVSRNRTATTALWDSVRTIKADAARRVFEIRCRAITWAIVDTGIDARHPAFLTQDASGPLPVAPLGVAGPDETPWRTRIIETYDFTLIRDMLSLALPTTGPGAKKSPKGMPRLDPFEAADFRKRLLLGKDIDWGEYAEALKVPYDAKYPPPTDKHGTHVAGILGADFHRPDSKDEPLRGVCPDIRIIDMRVFDDDGTADEFSILAALQFVGHLNSHSLEMVVHGVNLSLSLAHDVSNYACGQTPICDECKRLIGDGLVVVAAAGNQGRHTYLTPNGLVDQYTDTSVTDPGNSEDVITVGSTHRSAPHAYGISYFSSRGPTGDGRIKPDLVAPGEKIMAPVPEGQIDTLDGTSMAAPHVSGAAAMLMATRREFIGDPVRIKSILCETATDLGRERYFQGHGAVDILRAIQSV